MFSLKKFVRNRHGLAIQGIIMGILGIVILAVLVANVLPDSVAQISTTANWTDAGVPAASPVIPLMTTVLPIVIGIVVILMAVALVKSHD